MTEHNPYQAPESELSKAEPQLYPELNFKQLKTLWYRTRNLRGLGLLWVLASIMVAFALLRGLAQPDAYSTNYTIILAVLTACYVTISVLSFIRHKFTPYLGIALGFLLMVSGTWGGIVIGTLVIASYWVSRDLFGDTPYIYKKLNQEYKYRKKEKLLD